MRSLDPLLRRVAGLVAHGVASVQVAIARRGELLVDETFGDPGVPAPARYVLQSAGRTLVASAVWKLLGDGLLRLDEPVAAIVPEFGTNGKGAVTVEHVLTHTGGFPFAPLGYPKMADRALRLAAFGKWRLDEPPGRTLAFHLTSAAWVLAEVVERRAGVGLPEYLRREICAPLGLGAELGVPVAEQRGTVAPMVCSSGDATQLDPWGPWYLDNADVVAAGEPAHAVVASASDVARHYQALLAALDGDDAIWDPATVVAAVAPRVTAVPVGDASYGGGTLPVSVGLFVVVAGPHGGAGAMLPARVSPAAFGNAGAAYQLGFADPATGLSFALLSNGYPASGYDRTPAGARLAADLGDLAADLCAPP